VYTQLTFQAAAYKVGFLEIKLPEGGSATGVGL